MKETGYRVKQEDKTFCAYKNGLVLSKGCIVQGDALQAIWIDSGRNKDETFIIVNDVVVCVKDKQ
jgi:hypothetical protein